jgi:uncharacterized membrane protein
MSASDVTPEPGVRPQHREEMRLNRVISRVLIVGLLVAVGLLVVGVVLALARPGGPMSQATSITKMPGELAAGRASGFFELGLLVLLATPFARVVALAVAFSSRRQWLFAGISSAVGVLLIVGAALGLSLR